MTDRRFCIDCSQTKPLAEFNRDAKGRDGRRSYCKPCQAARKRRYLQGGGSRVAQEWRWQAYGLTPEAYQGILSRQGGVCGVCGSGAPRGAGSWHIDHDHSCCSGPTSCGRCVRGLLCARCNSRVLPIVEDAELLKRALAYLAGARA